jgi:hypothetical protein
MIRLDQVIVESLAPSLALCVFERRDHQCGTISVLVRVVGSNHFEHEREVFRDTSWFEKQWSVDRKKSREGKGAGEESVSILGQVHVSSVCQCLGSRLRYQSGSNCCQLLCQLFVSDIVGQTADAWLVRLIVQIDVAQLLVLRFWYFKVLDGLRNTMLAASRRVLLD